MLTNAILELKYRYLRFFRKFLGFDLEYTSVLIEFSVANFRSFGDRVTFSMVASSLKAKLPELNRTNLFAATDKLNLLTSAAIYGANASGKSNLILALAFMIDFVKNSTKGTERVGKIDVSPFRLNSAYAKEPSFFEVVFLHNGKQYRYGFKTTDQQVEAEWCQITAGSEPLVTAKRIHRLTAKEIHAQREASCRRYR